MSPYRHLYQKPNISFPLKLELVLEIVLVLEIRAHSSKSKRTILKLYFVAYAQLALSRWVVSVIQLSHCLPLISITLLFVYLAAYAVAPCCV